MGEIVPGIPVLAGIFANRAPLSFTKVRSPFSSMELPFRARHSIGAARLFLLVSLLTFWSGVMGFHVFLNRIFSWSVNVLSPRSLPVTFCSCAHTRRSDSSTGRVPRRSRAKAFHLRHVRRSHPTCHSASTLPRQRRATGLEPGPAREHR
jgi:hypothetical protein